MSPPTNYFNHKTQSTLLVFSSAGDADAFQSAIPPSTFGPLAAYTPAPSPRPAPKPKTRPARGPMVHVVVRGVDPGIGDKEFLEALSPPEACPCGRRFARAQRIVGRDGQPTGLVRLFMSCQTCCEALLKNGLSVLGRPYRVEAPRNALIRPCGRCHEYGHDHSRCSRPHPLCRVCGLTVRTGAQCDHEGHDLSRPYCASCNKYGHYTGQRHCPRYPRDPSDPHSNPPVRILTPPAPPSNPWNLRLTDFPSLTQVTPPPPSSDENHKENLSDPTPSPPHDTTSPSDDPAHAHNPANPEASSPPTNTFVTHEALTSFLDQLLTAISEGFKRTFDALLSLLLTSVPAHGQQRVREAVNSVTKRLFDTRTILHNVGSGMSVIHTDSKRPSNGRPH